MARLTPDNVRESLRDVRRALLEADVQLDVARDFVRRVEERAMGEDVLKSLTPGQQVVGIVHEELVRLLGKSPITLASSQNLPTVVLLAGLQGSGKTTFAGKLARWLKARGKRTLNVLPSPTRLVARMLPCRACTRCLTIDSPSPVPPSSRDRARSTR